MASFGLSNRSRHKAGKQGFSVDNLNSKTAMRQRAQMRFIRTVFSAISLLFGAFMIYISMHYIPAFVRPSNILKVATGKTVASETYDFDRNSNFHSIFGPYLQLFHLDRAYMGENQGIRVKYDLPSGAYADIDITQCRRAWVVEIFDCRVVSTFRSRTKHRSGIESFSLEQGGFYQFRHTVSGVPAGETYRIVWERS